MRALVPGRGTPINKLMHRSRSAVQTVASCASRRGGPGVFIANSAPYRALHPSKTIQPVDT
ncbi:hypothetical protein COMA2_20080 [Candidatus Nitrospira nitrificans]|uniref:Uncharacterized protein n=1 Tax=Candidatus Nitrospira nitrificans TaxID=1742973 RepID=A0A0S4LEJ7_9BACT|nr:hypothetical protein COMA2_20080 [Candidatus Nitrospira nitrificans]